jgi:translation initiation factor IF-2
MATINQSLDVDTASIVAAEFGYEVEKVGFSEEEFILPQKEDQPEELVHRPPVVTIMGHVDHGKTSLLDAIRKSHIIDKEAGGITQHIGAYHVNLDGNSIIFLDTPGHEAFTEMRSRGAQVTDLVILIVAADDGVMDQTKEAINHAKAAEVPIIVAVNKIDKDNADTDRVKRELADHGLISEEWGGETIFSYVSAKQRTGLEQLLEMVLLQSEMLELKANPKKRARGHIIEAQLDKGRGPVGTVLVQEGSLNTSDPFVCGVFHGRVRAMLNDRAQKIDSAGPSMPVEVQGFEGVPNAGDEFVVVENEKVARRIAEARQLKQREKELAKETKVTLESFFQAKQEEAVKTLNLVLKADVQGSLEAVSEAIQQLTTEEVKVKIIHGGIGAITESDIKLAAASSAVIVGFNVRPSSKVKDTAEQEGVDIRFYTVIYQLVNEVKEAMAGMLSPVTKEVYLGQAEVRDTFTIPKVGTIAGCFVLDGKLQRNAGIRLLRDGVVMYTGKLSSLKRFKDDVKEVTKDYECGVGLEKYNDIKQGDIIEAFDEVQERPTLG